MHSSKYGETVVDNFSTLDSFPANLLALSRINGASLSLA